MEPTDREIADRLEVVVQRSIPIGRSLRLEAGIVNRERLARLIDGFVGQTIVHPRPAKTCRPTKACFQVRRDVVSEVGAGKSVGVAALELTTRVGVVAFSRADRIGRSLRRGAAGTGTDPTPALGIRFLDAHTRKQPGVADFGLQHAVAGHHTLSHRTGAGVVGRLRVISVFVPETRINNIVVLDELGRRKRRSI